MIINSGTSSMRVVPDGTVLIKVKCKCSCHVTPGMMHFIGCCDNGFIEIPIIEHIDPEKETLNEDDNQTISTT